MGEPHIPTAVLAPGDAGASAGATDVTEAEALRRTLEKAAMRDRKRAGMGCGETIRQKNARKMKLGQSTFSLKDERDCVNPFVDNSNDPHVQGFVGRRVDKRASVKQISK